MRVAVNLTPGGWPERPRAPKPSLPREYRWNKRLREGASRLGAHTERKGVVESCPCRFPRSLAGSNSGRVDLRIHQRGEKSGDRSSKGLSHTRSLWARSAVWGSSEYLVQYCSPEWPMWYSVPNSSLWYTVPCESRLSSANVMTAATGGSASAMPSVAPPASAAPLPGIQAGA